MTIKTFDKDGNASVCWLKVNKIKLMTLPRKNLLNLHMTLEDGQEIDYYLSDHERFAIIE